MISQSCNAQVILSGHCGNSDSLLTTGVLVMGDELYVPSATLGYWSTVLQSPNRLGNHGNNKYTNVPGVSYHHTYQLVQTYF